MSPQAISTSSSPSRKSTKPDLHMDFSTLPLIQPSPPSNTLLITVSLVLNLSLLRKPPSLTFRPESSRPIHIHPILVIANPRPHLRSRPTLFIFPAQIFPTDHRLLPHRPSRHHHPPVPTQFPISACQPHRPHLLWRTHPHRHARSTPARAPQQKSLLSARHRARRTAGSVATKAHRIETCTPKIWRTRWRRSEDDLASKSRSETTTAVEKEALGDAAAVSAAWYTTHKITATALTSRPSRSRTRPCATMKF